MTIFCHCREVKPADIKAAFDDGGFILTDNLRKIYFACLAKSYARRGIKDGEMRPQCGTCLRDAGALAEIRSALKL